MSFFWGGVGVLSKDSHAQGCRKETLGRGSKYSPLFQGAVPAAVAGAEGCEAPRSSYSRFNDFSTRTARSCPESRKKYFLSLSPREVNNFLAYCPGKGNAVCQRLNKSALHQLVRRPAGDTMLGRVSRERTCIGR